MTPDEILKAFDNIRVWQRGDRRAPHKPLLILVALGSLARGEKPRAEFAEIEDKLGRLLEEFGPSGSNTTCTLFSCASLAGLFALYQNRYNIA